MSQYSKLIVLTLLFSLSLLELKAQETNENSVPSSPAFTILNFEPTSVLRPTSPAELRTSILNSFDDEGKFQPNLGIEFSPYWLKSRDSLTEQAYFDPTTIQTIKQTFQFSAATVQDTALNNNKLGLGFRFQLVQGQPSKKSLLLRNQLQNQHNTITIINGARAQVGITVNSRQQAIDFITTNLMGSNSELIINKVKEIAESIRNNYDDSSADIKSFIEKIQTLYGDTDIANKKFEADRTKTGLIIEIGGATALQSGKNDANPDLQQIGFWASASERMNNSNQWVFTARYLSSRRDSAESSFDAGLSYIKDVENFSLSFEAVARWYKIDFKDFNLAGDEITRTEDDFTYRIAANLNYSLNEYIFINASFGKGFNSGLTGQANFFSIIGLNYNLFRSNSVKLE